MIKKLFKKRRDNRQNISLALEHGGHRLYTFDDVQHMSAARVFGVLRCYSELACGLRHADIKAFAATQRKLLNEGDLVGAAALLEHIEQIIDSHVSERIIIEAGGWAVLVDDEPTNEPRPTDNKLKGELLESSEEVRFFFIKRAIEALKALTNTELTYKPEEFINLIKTHRDAQRQIHTKIGSGSYGNLWSQSQKKSFTTPNK